GVETVLIHDGARPLVSRQLIDRVLGAGGEGGVVPALPVPDTLKEVDADGRVLQTIDRSRFRRVQTPQLFPLDPLRRVYELARTEGFAATDDAALFERYGLPVVTVTGD